MASITPAPYFYPRHLLYNQLRLAVSRVLSRMTSTEAESSTKPMSEKQRLKLEKFAKKKEKQEQDALLKQQQPISSTREKKSNEQNAPAGAVMSKDWVEETPAGHLKILKSLDDDFHKAYLPKVVESAWYSYWEKQGMFKPQTGEDGNLKPKGKYVIAIPPPNVCNRLREARPFAN